MYLCILCIGVHSFLKFDINPFHSCLLIYKDFEKAADVLRKFRQYLAGKTDVASFHYDAAQRTYDESAAYCHSRGADSDMADIRTKTEQESPFGLGAYSAAYVYTCIYI